VKEKHARQQRADGVARLERDLVIQAGKQVRVDTVLQCWGAWKALAEDTGLHGTAKQPGPAYGLAWTHWKEGWARLAERVDKDTAAERWVLLPGFEARCHELFAKAVGEGLGLATCQGMVQELCADHAEAEKKAAQAKRREAEGHAAEQQQQTEAALATVEEKTEQVQAVAQKAGSAQTEEEKRAASEEMAQAKTELYEAQQRHREEGRKRKDAEDARRKAEREEKERGDRADKERRKAEGQAPPQRRRAEGCRQPNPPAREGACGTVRDTVDMVVGLIVKHDEQDDVALGVARALAKHVEMSRLTQRAFANAAEIIERGTAPAKAG
jgi:hypothetical protein